MKNMPSLFLSLILAVCLTLYGHVGMAKAGDTGFEAVICADGVVATVRIGADGNPVEPTPDCPDCPLCGTTALLQGQATGGDAIALVLLDIDVVRTSVHDPVLNKRNILPAPRGPPALHHTMQGMPDLIGFDQGNTGHNTRSDGRPLTKDADA